MATRDELLQNNKHSVYTPAIRKLLIKEVEQKIIQMNDPEPYQIAETIIDFFFLNPLK